MRGQRRRREAGFALAISLLVLLVVSLALSLISLSLILRLRAARQESQGVLLTALVDAALAEALSRLALDAAAPGVAEHPFGSGAIASTITPVSTTQFTIVATGRLGQRRRAVQADVQRTPATIQVSHWRLLPPASR